MARLDALRGFGVLDPRWGPGLIDSAESDYTQAGPRPGSALTTGAGVRAAPQVLGVQPEPVTVVGVQAAGHPGRGEHGGAVGYYLPDQGETVDDLRSWEPPIRLTGATYGPSGNLTTATPVDAAVNPLSGRVVTQSQEIALAGSDITEGAALAYIPGTGTLIAVSPDEGITAISDDDGATWTTTARWTALTDIPTNAWGFAGQPRRMVFDGAGSLLLAAKRDDGTDHWQIHASGDLGATWDLLGSPRYRRLDLASRPDGAIVAAWVTTTTKFLAVGVLPIAALPADAEPVTLDDTRTWDDVTVGVDEDGVVWVLAREEGETLWEAWYSLDGGQTWPLSDHPTPEGPAPIPVFRGGSVVLDEVFYRPRLVFSDGIGHLTYGVGLNTNMRTGTLQLGGWASPTLEVTEAGFLTVPTRELHQRHHYLGGGRFSLSTAPVNTSAIHQPFYDRAGGISGGGWTDTTSGTGAVVSSSNGSRYRALAAADTAYSEKTSTETYTTFEVEASTDAATQYGVALGFQGPVYAWRLEVRDGSWRVFDTTAGSSVGLAVTRAGNDRVQFRVVQTGATLTIWWREWDTTLRGGRGGWTNGTRWSGPETRTISAGSYAAGSRLRMGFPAPVAATGDVDVAYLCARATTLADFVQGVEGWGKAISAEDPYPLPDLYDSAADRQSRLRLQGGPVLSEDTYTIDPAYDHPIRALFPTVSPSPEDQWRSVTTGVDQDLVLDPSGADEDTALAATFSVALAVQNTNVRRVELQQRRGGAYTTVGTLDLATGFTGLDFSRVGDLVTPGAGGVDGGRYIRAGELAGGHVVMTPAGGGAEVRRRVAWNTGGWWGDILATTAVRPKLQIEGVDGTEPTNGTLDLVWPSGVLIVHLGWTSTNQARRWRIRIPSSEETVDGDYRAGEAAVYPLLVPGKQWGHGPEINLSPNLRVRTDARGTEWRERRGKAPRVWTVSWDHGALDQRIRGTPGDYLASTSGDVLAARDAVWDQLDALYQITEDGARPVLLLTKIPQASGETITDRTLWLAGYLDSDHRISQASGLEGESWYYRAGPVRVRERV